MSRTLSSLPLACLVGLAVWQAAVGPCVARERSRSDEKPQPAGMKGLLGHWRFDPAGVRGQTVKDHAGKADATITGTVAFAKVGTVAALKLDGKSVAVSVREKYQEAPVPVRAITVAAWVRVDRYAEWGGFAGILQDNGAYEKGWLLGYQHQKFTFAVKAARGPAGLTYLQAAEPFETGQWYHVVGVYDGAVQQLYVNGKQAASSRAQSGDIDYPPKAFYQLGAYRDEDEFYRLTGLLHEVLVWNRALTADEIARQYRDRAVHFPPVPTVRLPRVFGNGMVLQRDRKLPVWGWADAGEVVTATCNGATAKTTTGKDGRWRLELPPQKAGGPYDLVLAGKKSTRTIRNVMVGEVWLCSGQSNMQWSVWQSANPAAEIAAAQYPRIRMFTVPNLMSATPAVDCGGYWQECSPEAAGGFSAVAYYFGRHLHRELNVPIGLINASWGGSLCEAWTSREALARELAFVDILKRAEKNLGAGTGMFNQMIHPLIPFALRGAIWYQGESNVSRAYEYRKLFPTMIADWRERWGQGDFPFYYVQLAPFNYRQNNVACAELWEAQLRTLAVRNTGMAVTTDIGHLGDIHPKNKQEVGRRLALWALARTYGQKGLVFSGPLYKAMRVAGDRVRITFDHTGGGLASRDGKPLSWFTIAGTDRTFHPAEAVIDKEAVVVRSAAVKEPVAVRFAWNGTAQPNLMNREGLPASPFRTDDWPGVTAPPPGQPATKKVLLIGIDGCRLDAIDYSQAKHLKALIKEGAVADRTDVLGDRKTKADTASGPGWASILTGVWSDKHGVIDNTFRWAQFKTYPSFLTRLKQARPTARTAALITWKPLHDHLFTPAEGCQLLVDGDRKGYEEGDRVVAEAGARLLGKEDIDLAFVYFGNVDSAGHGYGFHPRSPKYTNSIEAVDGYIGRLLEALRRRPRYAQEDWLIIVCTDHGGKGRGHSGGATEPEIRNGFLILHGAAVQRGKITARTANVDVAVTALTHLGVAIEPRGRLLASAVGLAARK